MNMIKYCVAATSSVLIWKENLVRGTSSEKQQLLIMIANLDKYDLVRVQIKFFFFFPFEFVNLFNFESEKVEKLKCKQKFTELMELYAENTIPNIFSIDFLK